MRCEVNGFVCGRPRRRCGSWHGAPSRGPLAPALKLLWVGIASGEEDELDTTRETRTTGRLRLAPRAPASRVPTTCRRSWHPWPRSRLRVLAQEDPCWEPKQLRTQLSPRPQGRASTARVSCWGARRPHTHPEPKGGCFTYTLQSSCRFLLCPRPLRAMQEWGF